jgi:hypothetical protein
MDIRLGLGLGLGLIFVLMHFLGYGSFFILHV